jgi:hypothetical protein
MNSFNPFLLGCAAVLLPILLPTTPAFGASRQDQEKVARKACLSGDYSKGVSILANLYVDTREPVYVFNQGRCFEQNLQFREALGRFEEYLRMGETASLRLADRAAAERHIADCKARLPEDPKQAQATAPLPFVQPPPPALSVPEPAPKSEPTVQTVEQPKAEPEPPKGRSILLSAGIVTGVIGVAAVGSGVAFNLKVNSMVKEMETTLDGYTPSANSSRKTYETLMWVGYGVGAACIATGAILVAVGVGARHGSSTNVALVPAVGPDHAGLVLRGDFR